MHSKFPAATAPAGIALAAIVALGTTACGGTAEPTAQQTAAGPTAASPVADAATGPAEAEQAAAAAKAAEQAAREQELKAKELELELRERQLADQQAAAAAAKETSSAPRATPAPRPAAAPAAAAPPPPPVTVAAGTQLSVRLSAPYSTRTTTVGEPVEATLASDLVVDGRRVAKAGAPLRGTVTEVTSGSRKIGAVPALKIDFTQLVVADGSTMPVSVRIMQKGPSEKGRDTAKIAGGTAAGAIIGHQIDDDKGKVIGGIIGGAAGAIGAQKTGTEVEIAAGSTLPANVRAPFTYSGR